MTRRMNSIMIQYPIIIIIVLTEFCWVCESLKLCACVRVYAYLINPSSHHHRIVIHLISSFHPLMCTHCVRCTFRKFSFRKSIGKKKMAGGIRNIHIEWGAINGYFIVYQINKFDGIPEARSSNISKLMTRHSCCCCRRRRRYCC